MHKYLFKYYSCTHNKFYIVDKYNQQFVGGNVLISPSLKNEFFIFCTKKKKKIKSLKFCNRKYVSMYCITNKWMQLCTYNIEENYCILFICILHFKFLREMRKI